MKQLTERVAGEEEVMELLEAFETEMAVLRSVVEHTPS